MHERSKDNKNAPKSFRTIFNQALGNRSRSSTKDRNQYRTTTNKHPLDTIISMPNKHSRSYNFMLFSSEKLSLIKKVYTYTNCKVHFHRSKLVFNFRSLILLSKSRQGRRKGWKTRRGQKVIKGSFDGSDFAFKSVQIWRGWNSPLHPYFHRLCFKRAWNMIYFLLQLAQKIWKSRPTLN